MKKISILFFLASAFPCFGQAEVEFKKFSPDELKRDIGFLFGKLENVHPSLYYYTSKAKVDSARAVVERELNQPMTRLEFARKVVPLVSMLKDAHTALAFPQEEYSTYLKAGGKVFPFNVLIRGNRIFITANYSQDTSIEKFAEIISINGISSLDLLNQLRPYMSAELDFYRDVRVQIFFRSLLWWAIGFEEDYNLKLELNGATSNKNVLGITQQELIAVTKNVTQASSKSFSYYKLTDDIGVINFRSMNDYEKFNRFLDSTFAILRKENLEHLVIDIRRNSGGNSRLGDALFNYITSKSYKQAERAEVKREGGEINVIKAKMTKPKSTKNKFNGKTYLLTSHFTFSSATMLAGAYKCYDMGTVIGEETGGVLTHFGDWVGITLPNTKLQASCSQKKFILSCADEQLHGVKPDVEIISTQVDIQAGRDAAIEYVKQLVAQSAGGN